MSIEDRVLAEELARYGDVPAEEQPRLIEFVKGTLGYRRRLLDAQWLDAAKIADD